MSSDLTHSVIKLSYSILANEIGNRKQAGDWNIAPYHVSWGGGGIFLGTDLASVARYHRTMQKIWAVGPLSSAMGDIKVHKLK